MIVFIRDNECFEPRLNTYITFIEKKKIPYIVIGWNRSGTAELKSNFIYFNKKAEFGKGIYNIKTKILWMMFVYKILNKYKNKIKYIHACDIDAAIPAYLFSKKNKKNLIFDIFDWLTTDYGNNIAFKFLELAENFIYKRADNIIICEEERKQQAKTKNDNVYVLPNIPLNNFIEDKTTKNKLQKLNLSYKLTLSYVGVFDKHRGLEELIDAVKKFPNINLQFAGFGTIKNEIEHKIKNIKNINYWKSVSYNTGQTILSNCDIMIAFYYTTNAIHKYAAPNKYYESLKLNKPLITNNGTILAEKVLKYDTGFVIDENIQSLIDLLSDPNLKNKITEKSVNCQTLWENKYKNYIDIFMNEIYFKKIVDYEKN